ncbi:hypothetical protein F8388_003376 [Cannabis sativa]|uniref:Tubulin-specific chaperone A n=1 Tax=Cannabis sativa TaxID=3483 RepID=A0A7J6E837_CANSA|nr:hypothetical protein G4B88_010058 [Cannabis sativa]KAF4368675.1 hypothetical protein F8388_003376 [Cannabis sativa]
MEALTSLKIKTSTWKRLVKEFHSYEKEVESEAAKTALMKENGANTYDLKQHITFDDGMYKVYAIQKVYEANDKGIPYWIAPELMYV